MNHTTVGVEERMAGQVVSTVSDGRKARCAGQRGAALVEFALIFPFFLMVVLGMFSGGQAYNRKISMTNAAAEASRYGATLAPSTQAASPPPECYVVGGPPGSSCGIDVWMGTVARAVIQNASGDLSASTSERRVCVAYVHPAATSSVAPHAEQSHMAVFTTSDTAPASQDSGPGAQCFSDGRLPSERRVQIEVSRRSPIDALLFSINNLTLTARSVTRFEATSY